MYRVALALAGPLAALILSFAAANPARALEAYLFRGAGDFSFLGKGLTFSNGMDRLGEKLDTMGVATTVYRWEAVDWAYRDIMKRRPDAVMIMGHSMGALSTITLASKLKGSGVRVAYIGTIDIPGPAAIVPSNVEVAENFYHAFPVYGQLTKPAGFAGSVRNQYIFGQIHITMDKSQKVHAAALEFASQAVNAGQTMQAYAETAAPEPELVARVDAALTGSTSDTHARTGAIAPATLKAAGGPVQLADLGLPDEIPVPVPAPRMLYATTTGLPPIE